MRILYCNKYNFEFSGTEVYLLDLMRLVRQEGHEAALFSMADSRGKPSPYDKYAVPPIDFKRPAGPLQQLRSAAHAIYSREARRRIRSLLSDFQPQLAHVRNIYHHLSPSILWELRRQGVPVIYHVNDFKMLCPSYNLVSKGEPCERCAKGAFRHVVSEGCYAGGPAASVVLAAEAYVHKWWKTYATCVDLLLAPTKFVRDKMVDSGWNPQAVEVLPHFQRVPNESPTAPSIDAPILYFGRLSVEKGVIDLVRAMRLIPNIRLIIAGDGPQREELEAKAAELGLKNVEFAGHVGGQQLNRLIAESCLTVFPSHAYETLGKSILESYAHGRPVVATDLGSRRELVIKGETGVLYEVGDVEQLAASIAFLYARPKLTQAMGEAGLEKIRRDHSPKLHYEALMQIYARVAALKTSRPLRISAPPPRLKIAFIGGRGVISRYSGIETYYEEAGGCLAKMGHDVTVYCRTYFTPEQSHFRDMRLVRLPTLRTKHMDTLLHTFLSTLHACRERYDVVHYHTLGPAVFSYLPRLFGARTVVTVQGLDWRRRKWGRLASAALRLGEWAAVTLPDRTIVVSRTLRDYFRRVYSIETQFVPNGTKLAPLTRGPNLARWNLEADQYVLFLGRFSPEKNCDLLIRAFEHTATKAKLVLAGGSSYTDEYVKEIRRHASDRVQFLDWVSGPALQELITNAALFVLPSDLEGLSLALLDAMGAGVCVLASDVPENRELVDDVGFTFPSGDEAELSRMLDLLLSDPEMRKRSGVASRHRVQESYLWPQIARELERVYRDAMGSPVSTATYKSTQNEFQPKDVGRGAA